MGVISLVSSGYLHRDDFSGGIDAVWNIVPFDLSRLDTAGTGLVLKHGAEPLNVLLTMLSTEQECVIDVKNSYVPLVDGDIGGLIVLSSGLEFIKLEEYFDVVEGTTKTYPWIRLVRNYNHYSAYWSLNGTEWNIIGSTYFSGLAPQLGVFLAGDSGEDYLVEEVVAYRNTYITVTDVVPGTVIDLIDTNGVVVRTAKCLKHMNEVKFNVADLPLPFIGTFKFTMTDGTQFQDSEVFEVWGGDSYVFSVLPLVEFEYTDPVTGIDSFIPAFPNVEKFMGYLGSTSGATVVTRMRLTNEFTGGSFKDVLLEVEKYLTDYHIDNVFIAEDVAGAPGLFGKTLTVAEITPLSEVPFWLSIEKRDITAMFSNNLTFGLGLACKFE